MKDIEIDHSTSAVLYDTKESWADLLGITQTSASLYDEMAYILGADTLTDIDDCEVTD